MKQLLLILILLFSFTFTAKADILVSELLAETNEARIENHLNPLSLNVKLTKAAENKAKYMFEQDYWAHVAPSGVTPWFFILQSGYDYRRAGENLAKGFTESDKIINGWLNSKTGHRESLLSPYFKDVGFAVIKGELMGENTTLVVQMFGQKANMFNIWKQ